MTIAVACSQKTHGCTPIIQPLLIPICDHLGNEVRGRIDHVKSWFTTLYVNDTLFVHQMEPCLLVNAHTDCTRVVMWTVLFTVIVTLAFAAVVYYFLQKRIVDVPKIQREAQLNTNFIESKIE